MCCCLKAIVVGSCFCLFNYGEMFIFPEFHENVSKSDNLSRVKTEIDVNIFECKVVNDSEQKHNRLLCGALRKDSVLVA